MKNRIFILFATVLGLNLSAQNPDTLFARANAAYDAQDYGLALENYKKIEAQGFDSFELQKNMGNANYRLGNVAQSIIAYNRALKFKPADRETEHNLKLAEALTVDKIAVMPESLWGRVVYSISSLVNFGLWAVFALAFAFLATSGFIVYLFAGLSSLKKAGFYGFLASLLLCFCCKYMHGKADPERAVSQAVVTASSIYAKNGPNYASGDAFILHEGAKFEILDGNDKWLKIRLSDGKTAWIERSGAEII